MGQSLSIVIILEIKVYSSIREEVYETLKSMKNRGLGYDPSGYKLLN